MNIKFYNKCSPFYNGKSRLIAKTFGSASERDSADGNSIEVCSLPARFTLREKYVLGHRRQFINGFFKSSLCNFIQSLSLSAPAVIISTISTFDRGTNLGQGWRKEKSICARACWVIICRSINVKVPSRIFFAAFPSDCASPDVYNRPNI